MTPATYNRRPTTAILAALQSALAALTLGQTVNAVPTGAVYSGAVYTLTNLEPGQTYIFQPGANDAGYQSGGGTVTTSPFVASSSSLTLIGSGAVTAGVFLQGPAFQRIEQFDSESLVDAFQLLTLSEKRLCLIVALDEQFARDPRNNVMLITRTLPVTLLISDRVLGDRTTALYGDNTTPGAQGLMELVLPAVTGLILPPPWGVTCEPVNSSVLIVKNQKEKQNLPGRAAVALELHCSGGNLQAAIGPVPVL